MDKYQEQMLKETTATLTTNNNESGKVEIKKDRIILTQNENYNYKEYTLNFYNKSIDTLDVLKGNKWETIESAIVNIDFENQIKKIRFNFVLVDSVELKIEYVLADKGKYDTKISEEKKAEYKYESNARMVYNIFGSPTVIFEPCCSDYGYTEVEFIATKASGTTQSVFPRENVVNIGGGRSYGGTYNPPKQKEVNIILQRKRNEEGCNYIQFTNIGECGLKAHIYQYNKNGKLLVDYEI